MTKYNDNNPFGLSPEERRVLYHWRNGDSMVDAYKKVMLSVYDIQALSEAALRKRVQRFFGTYRMREAMAATEGEKGDKAREDFKRWQETQKAKTINDFSGGAFDGTKAQSKEFSHYNSNTGTDGEENENVKLANENANLEAIKLAEENAKLGAIKSAESIKTAKDKWLESLNVSENPSSLTIYGTGQFLAYVAVKEIMSRQAEIRQRGISVLDKNGSVLTPTIISALKTAAAMILPFAPAPSAEDRKEMSKAAVLLGLFPEQILESPDDYTAPIPSTIDVQIDDKEKQ